MILLDKKIFKKKGEIYLIFWVTSLIFCLNEKEKRGQQLSSLSLSTLKPHENEVISGLYKKYEDI